MPNVITHGLLANEMLKQIPVSEVRSAMMRFEQAFIFGSNGPDFLFYYNVWPWMNQQEAQRISNFGEIIHQQKINEFTDTLIQIAQSETNPYNQAVLIAFIAGYLSHWALDTVSHPFVFYRSGKTTGSSKYWHYRYESRLDSLMVMKVFNQPLKDHPSQKYVQLAENQRMIIADAISQAVQQVYQLELKSEEVLLSMKCFYQVCKVLFDPQTRLYPWIQWIENKILKKPWHFSSHMIIGKTEAEFDELNLAREAWCNPTDPQEIHHDSFLQLFDQAISRASLAISQLNRILLEQASSMESIMQDRQFDTGKSTDAPMIVFDPIYK